MAVPTTGFGLVALELVIACTDYCFGLATVDILPPEGLFHPVLPVRAGGKLTFPLCRTCVAHGVHQKWKKAVLSGMVQHKQHWIKDAAGTGLGANR